MLEIAATVLSEIIKPVFEMGKELSLHKTEPRNKMVKALLKFYECINAIIETSERLVIELEKYNKDDKICWTINRNRKSNIADDFIMLQKHADELFDEDIKKVYDVLKITNREMYQTLFVAAGFKPNYILKRFQYTPQLDYSSDDANSKNKGGIALLKLPYEKRFEKHFSSSGIHANITETNIEKQKVINLDNDNELNKYIILCRSNISRFRDVMNALEEMIKKEFTLEDYFRA